MPIDHSWVNEIPKTKIMQCRGIPDIAACTWLNKEIDVIFVCETPLNYELFRIAKDKGNRVVQQYNYEFLDYFRNNRITPPSLFAAPSSWNIDKVKDLNLARTENWSVPVDTNKINFRKINKLETLVHIVGRPTIADRNGTIEFCKVIKHFKNRFRYKIYVQLPEDPRAIDNFRLVKEELTDTFNEYGDLIEVITNCDNNELMYESGDALILPRKYGGLCLPMYEALSAGMPVIMTNISPNYNILPAEWLANTGLESHIVTHSPIPVHKAQLSSLISAIELLEDNIEVANIQARLIAEKNSWDNAKDVYLDRLTELCK